MSKFYCGRGNNVSYKDCMNLLNTSFNFTTPDKEFITLLPKLYREELRPQDQNFVVIDENGALTAAVGAYDHELRVCGRTLHCRGIGNVAVHPEHRSKGYMNMAMDSAMRDMINDGVVISTLGGRRQRYLYFGYDKAGPMYQFAISRPNIRHVFRGAQAPFTVREITDACDPIIDSIIALNEKQPFTPVRKREEYLNIAKSWRARLFAVEDGERFVGYLIINRGNTVTEIELENDSEFLSTVHSLYTYLDAEFSVNLQPHQLSYRKALAPIAESLSINTTMHFNVLNYRAVADAFLALKLTYDSLPDGEISLLIHGYAGDERISISVKDGVGSVRKIDESTPVDYELSHAEAIAFIFAPISPLRECAGSLAKLYFPLPISMRHADEV